MPIVRDVVPRGWERIPPNRNALPGDRIEWLGGRIAVVLAWDAVRRDRNRVGAVPSRIGPPPL